MGKSWGSGTERVRRLFDKTWEAGAWTGIIMSRTLLNVMPPAIREKMGLLANHFDDRRQDRRLHVDRTVSCMRNGKDVEGAHLINISKGGMYVEMERPSGVGQELSFNLSGRNLGPILRVRGRVTRSAERGMAIEFI